MLDRLFSHPLVAFGFIIAVVYLALFYIAQREKAQVNQMRGGKQFSPRWSSGRKHQRRRGMGRRDGFSPKWNRDRPRKAAPKAQTPEAESEQPDREPGT